MLVNGARLKDLAQWVKEYGPDGVSTQDVTDLIETVRALRSFLEKTEYLIPGEGWCESYFGRDYLPELRKLLAETGVADPLPKPE